MKITLKDLEKMKRDGTIRGFSIPDKQKKCKDTGGRVVSRHWEKRSKEKDWLGWNLLFFCNNHALILEEEYKFDVNGRQWKGDYCIPALSVLVEYEGIFSEKSRHTSLKGYTGDTDKYREAAKQGWIVLRYTAKNYKQVINDLNEILKSKLCP